jgi:glutamine synthetase
MNFSIVDPFTNEPYSRDPRNIAAKAEAYLKSTGIADTAYFGAEAEFYVFDDVRFETKANASYYYIDSIEGAWNTGRVEEGGNRGYKTRYKGGYFPVPPVDHFADIRDEICLKSCRRSASRSSAATTRWAPQASRRSTTSSTPCCMSGDDMMKFKYVVKNTAWEARQERDLHAEADLRRQRLGHAHPPVAVEGRRAALLRRARLRRPVRPARWYIGGLLKHAPALLAFTNPTVNSYHRLVPGYEAPVNLVYSARNRSACIRIPITGTPRRPSASSSASPTRPATPTSPSRRS